MYFVTHIIGVNVHNVTVHDCSGTCCGLKAHQALYWQLLLIILHNYMYTYIRTYVCSLAVILCVACAGSEAN